MRNEQDKGVKVMSTNYAYNLNEVREFVAEYISQQALKNRNFNQNY